MATTYLTTANVAVFNKTDMDLVVDDILNASPLLRVLAARTCKSNSFVYTRKTVAPSVGFRAANDGIFGAVTTREKITVSLGILDASFAVDVAVAQADERGWQHIMAEEAIDHLRAAMFQVEKQVLNGTKNVGTNAFAGLADSTYLDVTGDSMVVDAGGAQNFTGSSVYLIRSGPGDIEVLWGQDGEIAIGDMQVIERAGESSGTFPAYYHPITGWAGLKIGSIYSAARIANITEETNCGLDDDLIAEALGLFPADRPPTHIVMNRRSLRQLQQSRTATNATGAPAPFPTEAFNVPIIVTDALLNTEQLLGA